MKKVLFVCSGNTCRSPMAEAIFNRIAKDEGLDMTAESAGLFAFTGDDINVNSLEALREIGIDMSAHRSRRFDINFADDFNLIATMSSEQKRYIELSGIDSDKIISLNVEDPYGGDIALYRRTRDEIEDKLHMVAERLKSDES